MPKREIQSKSKRKGSSKARLFKGTLLIKEGYSYLVRPLPVGKSILLYLNVPTGAWFFEGFTAATHYFQHTMKKSSGASIEVHGVKSRVEKATVIQFVPN